MKLTAATVLLFSFAYPLTPQECKCRASATGATTRTGYFSSILVESKTRYKRLAGVVYLHDDPVEDVLVELFPYSTRPSAKNRRLAACVTEADGRYCFAGIPKGRYQIRASKDGGFQITYVNVYVDLRSRNSSKAELGIPIEVGY